MQNTTITYIVNCSLIVFVNCTNRLKSVIQKVVCHAVDDVVRVRRCFHLDVVRRATVAVIVYQQQTSKRQLLYC